MKEQLANDSGLQQSTEPKRPAYDPNNLSPEDEEARKHDDNSEGIDWDEIIATTQDDWEAGRFCYNSADYATQEEASAALQELLDSILEGVLNGASALLVSQFAFIYAYVWPSVEFPHGVVSIRAVRHVLVQNVFAGVKEPVATYAAAVGTIDAGAVAIQ